MRLLSAPKVRNWRSGSMGPEKIPAGVLDPSIQSDRNRAISPKTTCSRKDARSAATPNRLISSLKSSQYGDNATASIPAVRVRLTIPPSRHRPPDHCRGRYRADAVSWERGWRRDVPLRAPQASAFRAWRKHRQHGLDTFAGSSNIICRAEANGVAEKMSHRAPRCVDRCLSVARKAKPGWRKVGAVHACDRAPQDR